MANHPIRGSSIHASNPTYDAAAQEDAYWHSQFSKAAYYAAGRSYDQYQPAYALGWRAALAQPEMEFNDLELQLERQWLAQKSTSLLPWREVQPAVKEAWLHVRERRQAKQVKQGVILAAREISQLLHGLYRACVLLADDLRRMRTVEMGDFAQQVLGRHMQLLRKLAQQLKARVRQDKTVYRDHPLQPLRQHLHSHWRRLKLRLNEWDAAQVFEVCELREQSLLSAYQTAMRNPLPAEDKALLKQHAKVLKSNMDKLGWVRQNWVL